MRRYILLALLLSVLGCVSTPGPGSAPSKALTLPPEEKGAMGEYAEYSQRTEKDARRLNAVFEEWGTANKGIYEGKDISEEGLKRLDDLYQGYLQEYSNTAKPHAEEFRAFVLENEEMLLDDGIDTYATLEMLGGLEQQAENNLFYMRSSRKKLSLGTFEFRQGS